MAYPVTDLIRYRDPDGKTWSDFDTLIETITSTIAPDTWDEVGGAGAIEAMPIQDTDVLVISQTQQTQQEIASILQRLRTIARKDRPDGEVPVKERPEYLRGDTPPGAGGFGGAQGMGGGMGGMGGGLAVSQRRAGDIRARSGSRARRSGTGVGDAGRPGVAARAGGNETPPAGEAGRRTPATLRAGQRRYRGAVWEPGASSNAWEASVTLKAWVASLS